MKAGTKLKTVYGEVWEVTEVGVDNYRVVREDGLEMEYNSEQLNQIFVGIPERTTICAEIDGDCA
jgi:hypothetical protein